MISEFQQYLVDNGFKRGYMDFSKRSSPVFIEDYESMNISTYGPLCYQLTRGGTTIYWGLCVKGRSPYYYTGIDTEFHVTGDNLADLNRLLKN